MPQIWYYRVNQMTFKSSLVDATAERSGIVSAAEDGVFQQFISGDVLGLADLQAELSYPVVIILLERSAQWRSRGARGP